MDKEKLKGWLIAENHDRQWLADQLGCSKGTVDQWFSRGFPDWAVKSIKRLMDGPQSSSDFEVTFTAAEFERIEHARDLLKMATRKEFYETAITEYADQIIASEGPNKSSFKSASGIAGYETAQPCATTAASTSSSPPFSSPSAPARIVTLPAPPILGTVVHDGLNPTPHLLNESTTPAPAVPEPRHETRYPKPKKPRRKNGTED